MKKLVDLLKDLAKALIIGLIVSFIIGIVIGLIAFIVQKGSAIGALQVVKSVLLIVGALGLVLCAILILKKKSEKPLEYIEQWKEKYRILSYKVVIAIVSFTILFLGGIIDWFLFYKL